MSQANALEEYMLELINAERAAHGLNPLVFNGDLNESSEIHSQWMLDTDIFSHTGANGSSGGDRMEDAGYVFAGDWTWGENVGWQSVRGEPGYQDDVRDLHEGLMNSPGHRANILDPDYEEIGIGIEVGMFGQFNAVMVTQNFAASDATTVQPGMIYFTDTQRSMTLTQSQTEMTVIANNLDNTVIGAGSNETFYGGDGFDTMYGGLGDDTLNGQTHADELHGGAGHDSLNGGQGFDLLYGEAGNDLLEAGDDPDRLYGGTGDDQLYGGSNFSTTVDGLWGEAGHDTLYGEAGFDYLDGGDGNDLLDGGHQADNLYGRNGDDTLRGDLGLDRLFGGAGNDFGRGGDGDDGLHGEQGDDTLFGEAGNDRFFGGTGNDYLDGGEGADSIYGGAGFDTLVGGTGNDRLQGDFNADTFVFADGHGQDTITDFDATNDFEKINLRNVSTITSLNDLMANHATQQGGNVVIDTGGGNAITLLGVSLGDLDASDFIF